jgi:Ca2+:H+ antiporter
MLNWLLLFVPLAIGLDHFAPDRHVLIFVCSSAAIIPLAGWMGRSTEHLAERTGEGIGGLLNATFGNAAELIIAIFALREGLHDVVKASLAGSIIGNLLLVMGAAMFAGGLRHHEQRFNASAARSQATMLTLAAIALMLLAAYYAVLGPTDHAGLSDLSLVIAVVLGLTYVLNLVFSLITHRHLFAGGGGESGHRPRWSLKRSLLVLGAATATIAWMSEIMVGTIEPAAKQLGMNSMFVGVFAVAVIGNAAEHSTAVLVAMKNRMDLAMSIAIGSSVQIALFVAPVLVILSHAMGPRVLDLAFHPGLVLAVVAAVLITGQVAEDGQSNWIEGIQLLVVYLILAIVFFFLPLAPPGQ